MQPEGARFMGDDGKSDELKSAPSANEDENSDLRPRKRRPRDRANALPRDRAGELQARQRAIGLELRRVFDEIVEEPIPSEFLKLLDDIDRKRDQ